MKYYELRILGYHWGTGYRGKSLQHAIYQFLTDPLYHFKPGNYEVQFRNGSVHKVELKQIVTQKVVFI